VPDELRPLAAIRVTRPYATEDEFLEHELDTLTRTSVTLVGAQPRPQGVILRFELVLTTGQVVLRGEGRVVALKPNALRGMSGLSLRFTRLDSRSKTLLDKATALRERRRPSSMIPPPEGSSPTLPSLGQAIPEPFPSSPHGAVPEPFPPSPSATEMRPLVIPRDDGPGGSATGEAAPLPAPPTEASADTQFEPPAPPAGVAPGAPPPSALRDAPARTTEPPPHRHDLLARLRARAKALDVDDIDRILNRKRPA
jgi:hypothetical protein